MLGRYTRREVTISDGEALSDALKMNGLKLVGIVQPADCEGTAFGLKASYDEGANYVAVYNAIQESTGAAPVTALWEVTKSATVAQWINLPAAFHFRGADYIKVQSEDGSNAASNQTGDAVITLVFEEETP
jgi:hypothetical protein